MTSATTAWTSTVAGRLAVSTLLAVVGVAALQALRLRDAVRHGRSPRVRTEPDRRPASGLAKDAPAVLLVGDSTGVGVGASGVAATIAGRLAADFAGVRIVNLARDGDRVADTLAVARRLLADGGVADCRLVLLLVGGNDVLHATPLDRLRRDAEGLLVALSRLGRHVVWMGAANVGLAPPFVPPFSWWLSARGRSARDVFAAASARAGADFIDFFHEAGRDPFSADPARYYAPDGVHPGDAAYRRCYRALARSVPLAHWLGDAGTGVAPLST